MKNKPVIIVGAGGHAKVVAVMLKLCDRDILGFTTPDLKAGAFFFGAKVLGGDACIKNYSPDEVELANGVGALPNKKLRWKLASILRERGYNFTTIISPDSIVAADVSLAEGVQIMAGVVIQPGVKIGKDSIINTGALIDHDCKIAERCHIAPGVICSGGVEIGSNTHLGTGTIVTEYRSIGSRCSIAAGSIVYRDVPDSITFIQSKYQK